VCSQCKRKRKIFIFVLILSRKSCIMCALNTKGPRPDEEKYTAGTVRSRTVSNRLRKGSSPAGAPDRHTNSQNFDNRRTLNSH
jgi:hypothetical protein